MPSNNHALIRYKTIDRCLKSTARNYFLEDLVKECSDAVHEYEESRTGKNREYKLLSRRAILYDLNFMKDDQFGFGAPIEHDNQDGYYYEDPSFEAFKAHISKSDIEKLSEALSILKQLSGEGPFQDLDSTITRLEETYNIKRTKAHRSVVHFEHSTNIEGQKWVSPLKEFIADKQTLNILYAPFGRKPYRRIISPYFLKEYNNRWFLFAWDHDVGKITNLGMDRIKSIQESLQDYHLLRDFYGKSYLENVVGVTMPPGREKTEVILRAYGIRKDYLETKPIHSSQEIINETPDYADFRLHVIPNFELKSKIMQNADTIEVLSPAGLRKELSSKLLKAVDYYNQNAEG